LALAVEMGIDSGKPGSRRQASTGSGGPVRYLQPTELRAVLEACPEWLRRLRACRATGMRAVEVWGCAGVDIDFTGGRIMLPRRKTVMAIVYLNTLAQQLSQLCRKGRPSQQPLWFNGEPMTPETSLWRSCGLAVP